VEAFSTRARVKLRYKDHPHRGGLQSASPIKPVLRASAMV
jgi:hypothetical protein